MEKIQHCVASFAHLARSARHLLPANDVLCTRRIDRFVSSAIYNFFGNRGNVARRSRCGSVSISDLLLSVPVKEFCNSVNIWRRLNAFSIIPNSGTYRLSNRDRIAAECNSQMETVLNIWHPVWPVLCSNQSSSYIDLILSDKYIISICAPGNCILTSIPINLTLQAVWHGSHRVQKMQIHLKSNSDVAEF